MEHRSLAWLTERVEEVRASPPDGGRVELLACRPTPGERTVLAAGSLDLVDGLVGDCWRTRGTSSTPDGTAHPDRQVTLMNSRAVALIAGTRDRWPLAGDQLYVDLDLSLANLPAGTHLRVGGAVVEVTAEPHRGCAKFSKRFGVDAVRFVNSPAGKALNLRGINCRVVDAGPVAVGDRLDRVVAAPTP